MSIIRGLLLSLTTLLGLGLFIPEAAAQTYVTETRTLNIGGSNRSFLLARPDPMPASQTGKTLSADAFAGDAIIVAVKLAAPGAVLQIPARLCAAADLAAGPAWAAGPVLTGQFVKS